ncbi:MAG: site-specific DNA-methyltransferase [Pseudomonadota bacterium]|nr:site-specific DNA-methyltransferase [Pseudomonadota bacterium]
MEQGLTQQLSKTSNRLQIDYLDISQIKPSAAALRIHSKTRIKQLAASIQTFGFNLPLLVDTNSCLIAGHGLLEALKSLGWTEVPAITISHLKPAAQRAYAIALNRLGETGKWDETNLALELKSLSELDLDFGLEVTGFSMGEIDLKIEGLKHANENEAEQVVETRSGSVISQLGDLWLLDQHRLLCGSALDTTALLNVMAGQLASQVFTDPPYNVKIAGHVSGLGKTKHREFVQGSSEFNEEGFAVFLQTFVQNAVEKVVEGALLYICMDWRHIEELLAAAKANGLSFLNLCVWTKPNAGMGSLYRSQHELVFVFKKGHSPHQNNIQLGQFGRHRSNVWAYAANPGFGREGDEGNLSLIHPTVKPVKMVADAILDSSKRGDIILDPFLGSGTTLIAAQRVGRRCFGLELDPIYADVIIHRWQAFTGEKAIHGVTGESFDMVAASRSQSVTHE